MQRSAAAIANRARPESALRRQIAKGYGESVSADIEQRRTIEIRVTRCIDESQPAASIEILKGKYDANSRFPLSLISRHFSTGSRRLCHFLSTYRFGLIGELVARRFVRFPKFGRDSAERAEDGSDRRIVRSRTIAAILSP